MSAKDNKSPKTVSNIFHSIMKTFVRPPKKICLYCDLPMKMIQPPTKMDKVMVSKYECPNGHILEVSEKE